ncbi:MAG: hypothetical protein NZ602_05065 [Thermoguttaceae bacterium]|nr:hypothetical protein [Thermoguttaceae bacterium]MDW8039213.1 hypothetical protein [Thermoguttaceae bacterium]
MEGALPVLPLVLHHVPWSFRQALQQEGIPYRMYRPGPAQGRFLIFDSRLQPSAIVAPGQIVLDLADFRHQFPQDPFDLLEDGRSERQGWQIGPWRLEAEIARVDKRLVRQQVMDRLRGWLESHGGVWLRVAPFPFPYRSAFCFRLDHSDYHPEEFQRTLEAAEGWHQATSHFITAGAFQLAPEALKRLRGLDVGLHGYRYHSYPTEEENLANISRGKELLEGVGLEPIGFASPAGRWNRALLAALEKLGFAYSSEVGLAYDELPFHPFGSELLQIPVHPISLRLFLEAAEQASRDRPVQKEVLLQSAQESALEYFCQMMENRTLSGEAIFLYGEVPDCLGRYPGVLRAILAAADQYGSLWRTSLGEIYHWWQVRSKVHLTVYQTPDGYQVHTHRKPAGFRVGLELWRGPHVALVPLDRPHRNLLPNALVFEKRFPAPRPCPVRIDSPEGFRHRLRRWWYRYRSIRNEQMSTEALQE